MMKIMHLLRTTEYSGAENVVCQIMKMFKNEKCKMYYSSPQGNIEKVLNKRKINYIPMEKFNIKSFKKNIKNFGIDIIHAHDPGACVLAAFSGIKLPIIAHVHGNHDNMKVFSLKAFLFLIASKRFEKIIWVSDSALNEYYFRRLVRNKSIVLENVIDPEEVREKAGSPEKIEYDCIYLGRLSKEKNPLRAIRILSRVIEKNQDYKCVIIGDGPLRVGCQKKVKELKLENNIVFKGFLDNPYPVLKKSTVQLFSSNYEGTPMSALEAMCLGKPIVSTPTDGLIRLIRLGETGYYSWNEEKLANFLDKIHNSDKEKLEKLSIKVNEHFKEINNVDNYKAQLLESYLSITKRVNVTRRR